MKVECKVTFYWNEDFDEEEYFQENEGDTPQDMWNAFVKFIEDERIGKLETRADNCLPSDYHSDYTIEKYYRD